MTINPNDPAIPIPAHQIFNGTSMTWTDDSTGLTIRAEIAARAMQGLCANQEYMQNQNYIPENIAHKAVLLADALINELNKTV